MTRQLRGSSSARNRWADRTSAIVIGGGFLVVALVLAATTRSVTGFQWVVLALLMIVYVRAYRIEFVHREGSTVPTEPVLVAMLFLLPLMMVPLAVLVAQFAAHWPKRSDPGGGARAAGIRLISGWHTIGPVLVLLVAGVGRPELSHWPIYLAALAAQFLFDLVSALTREWAIGGELKTMFRPMVWTFAIDGLQAVIGLCAVIAGAGGLITIPLVSVPACFIALLIHDRRGLATQGANLGRDVQNAREEARVDPLTGLGNRRAWYEAVQAAEDLIGIIGSSVVAGLVAADINHLKYANDTLGHEVGDELIKLMADVTRSVTPTGATVCRVGGDEFAILVVGTAETLDLAGLVDRLRAAFAATPAISGLCLSVALGSAQCPPHPTLADAFRAADRAVFADKRAGRSGRISVVPPQAPRTANEGALHD